MGTHRTAQYQARAFLPESGRIPALAMGLFAMGIGIGVGVAVVAFMVGALRPGDVKATHDASGNVHACVSSYTGQTRIMRPGQAPNCTGAEFPVELGGGAAAADVEARLSALEDQVPDCLSEETGDAVFTGCDVEIRNGLDSTATQNGTGNLIVGYNENDETYARTGSHNIVVGEDHGYSNYGGLVAGFRNRISGTYASVSGGEGNTASGSYSSVSGGFGNEASGADSSVSGGLLNTASGINSSVSGGGFNKASGNFSSVSGGQNNEASGELSSVSGGLSRSTGAGATGPKHDWVAGTLLEDF